MNDSETVGISGLRWESNYCAETGPASYTLVANPGPLVTDFHLWLRDSYEAYVLHVGQEDRLTFIGPPDRTIAARFVDCRRSLIDSGQRSLIAFSFVPDPRRVLHVPQGIAMHFAGLCNVTVRSEPVLFAPSKQTAYEPGNDQIRISTATSPKDFPSIEVNDLPLPAAVLQSICRREQDMLASGAHYDTTFGIPVGNEIHRIRADR
ncbi:hypothetical protein [Pseudonocardia sp. NPDC046786]|uniref:hypothetical protein n=1 Tax=Pseudonocardia sp. NPDC046786 TaxID=3155471 RepID=UPI0033F8166A